MKKNSILTGIFIVLIFSLIIFTGCASKKATVTSDNTQDQAAATVQTPAQTTDASKVSAPPETTAVKEATSDQSSLMQATVKSPVNDIIFDFDSSSIRTDAREILQNNADYFIKNRISSVIIEGHCDERGTIEYNMALGQKRAMETKKYLLNLGVKDSVLKTVSYGEERPLDPGSNEDAWAKNRRAHFVVTP